MRHNAAHCSRCRRTFRRSKWAPPRGNTGRCNSRLRWGNTGRRSSGILLGSIARCSRHVRRGNRGSCRAGLGSNPGCLPGIGRCRRCRPWHRRMSGRRRTGRCSRRNRKWCPALWGCTGDGSISRPAGWRGRSCRSWHRCRCSCSCRCSTAPRTRRMAQRRTNHRTIRRLAGWRSSHRSRAMGPGIGMCRCSGSGSSGSRGTAWLGIRTGRWPGSAACGAGTVPSGSCRCSWTGRTNGVGRMMAGSWPRTRSALARSRCRPDRRWALPHPGGTGVRPGNRAGRRRPAFLRCRWPNTLLVPVLDNPGSLGCWRCQAGRRWRRCW